MYCDAVQDLDTKRLDPSAVGYGIASVMHQFRNLRAMREYGQGVIQLQRDAEGWLTGMHRSFSDTISPGHDHESGELAVEQVFPFPYDHDVLRYEI
jgi:hypothetical protein